MMWSPHKFRHMMQNWILISNYNWTLSFLYIYIYINNKIVPKMYIRFFFLIIFIEWNCFTFYYIPFVFITKCFLKKEQWFVSLCLVAILKKKKKKYPKYLMLFSSYKKSLIFHVSILRRKKNVGVLEALEVLCFWWWQR